LHSPPLIALVVPQAPVGGLSAKHPALQAALPEDVAPEVKAVVSQSFSMRHWVVTQLCEECVMKALKTTLTALCIAWLATMTLYAQTHRHSQQIRRKMPRPVWEIIHRTDLAR